MIVHKFGGTSLADAACIRSAAGLVRSGGEPGVVVVSAMAGVTNTLTELIHRASSGARLSGEPVRELARRHMEVAAALEGEGERSLRDGVEEVLERLRDALDGLGPGAGEDPEGFPTHQVLAAGEDLSVILMAGALAREGLDPVRVDARSVIRTVASAGPAVPRDDETWELARSGLLPLLEAGRTPVLQGFVGGTEEGWTTTLGRGGSDFTAAMVGAALDAREVRIWTDVDGIFSADPRVADGVRILPEMGYEEAVELAYFGARVVHPAAAKHAVARNVSMVVRNSFDPDAPGTRIRHDVRMAPGVAAVAHKDSVVLISVRCRPLFMAHGFLARVFEVLAHHGLPVDLVATSHTSTGLTVDREQELDRVLEELREFAEVEVVRDLAVVTVVGSGLLRSPGIVGRVMQLLDETPVRLVSQASDVSLNLLVDAHAAPGVVRRIHAALVGGGDREEASSRVPIAEPTGEKEVVK